MKKYLHTLLLCFVIGNALAQKAPTMELFATGFTGPDSIKNYVIIGAPGIKKADLFKKVMVYLNGLYTDPKSVIKAVEGESIIVDAKTNAIKGPYNFAEYITSYNIEMEFKDGKIKFEPTISAYRQYMSKKSEPSLFYVSDLDPRSDGVDCVWMVSKKGNKPTLFNPELKASSDQWVNNYIDGLVAKINEKW